MYELQKLQNLIHKDIKVKTKYLTASCPETRSVAILFQNPKKNFTDMQKNKDKRMHEGPKCSSLSELLKSTASESFGMSFINK